MTAPDRTPVLQSLSHIAVKSAKETDNVSRKVSESQEILFIAKTVFPFTLVPDTVSVDRTNLTIAHRVIFRVATIVTIKIEDIHNIAPNVGPIFGSLRIVTTFFDTESPYTVNYLRREDALKIAKIVKGYKTSRQRKIDTSKLNKKELVELLDKLARDGTEV